MKKQINRHAAWIFRLKFISELMSYLVIYYGISSLVEYELNPIRWTLMHSMTGRIVHAVILLALVAKSRQIAGRNKARYLAASKRARPSPSSINRRRKAQR